MNMIKPEVTRDIYPMPAFVTLVVEDVARTVDWYVNGLDFINLFTMPGPDGNPALVHLRRWRYQDILVRPGEGSPGTGWTFSVMASAPQLEELARRARAHGGGTVDGPYDTAWNTRDVSVTDPDGYTVVFTARRPEGETDEAFDSVIRRLADAQLPGRPGTVDPG